MKTEATSPSKLKNLYEAWNNAFPVSEATPLPEIGFE